MLPPELATVGADWLINEVDNLTDKVERLKPSEYNEKYRYLPASVTPIPGYIRYEVNPFMRELIDCFDVDNDVREVNIKKGVQITWTTLLESVAFYYGGHIKTLPMMYITADKELAAARIENNFIPMFNHSGMADIIRSTDEGNTRKTGKTVNHMQFVGGAVLYPFGAKNANKMRSFSIAIMLKDEVDGWPQIVGKDGDPHTLTDDRCAAYWSVRKIGRGSTPLILATSEIQRAYLRGDQRKYIVLCKKCSYPQYLRWETENKETGVKGGFKWDLEEGTLLIDSVRYCCQNCGAEHYELDKLKLLSEESGAHWEPTAKPAEEGIRSYHLPALYSPIGMQPWYKSVAQYLSAYDPIEKRTKDPRKLQVFYNNILAEPWEMQGAKIRFRSVSAHRRTCYVFGKIPNTYALKYSGSCVLMLTCQVDVHKDNLAVTVFGWCRESRPYVIDYWRFETNGKEGDECSGINSSVWPRLRTLIEETEYVADDGKKYRIIITLIDASYSNDTITTFCSDYSSGVYPILGRDRPGKNQAIKEFAEYTTQMGTVGYKIIVDHYKDRMAPVMRREWSEEAGLQKPYHFNAPMDMTDAQLEELTVETRIEVTDEHNNVTYVWHRPGNARNELWDLSGYGYAAVEIMAYSICIKHFELEEVDWPKFWDYLEAEKLYFTA